MSECDRNLGLGLCVGMAGVAVIEWGCDKDIIIKHNTAILCGQAYVRVFGNGIFFGDHLERFAIKMDYSNILKGLPIYVYTHTHTHTHTHTSTFGQ